MNTVNFTPLILIDVHYSEQEEHEKLHLCLKDVKISHIISHQFTLNVHVLVKHWLPNTVI